MEPPVMLSKGPVMLIGTGVVIGAVVLIRRGRRG
jgi:hypothetical protein